MLLRIILILISMDTLNYLIVESDQEYNNEVTLDSGLSLVVNTTIESVANVNRVVTIKSAPKFTILQKGDKVIIHHNILRRKNDINGLEVQGEYFIEDNLYFVPLTEVFAYNRSGKWIALDPFVFLKPIVYDNINDKINDRIIEPVSFEKYKKNIGTLQILNEEVVDWGLSKGDEIYFTDNSEYEFEIDGELLYRMKTSDLLGKVI